MARASWTIEDESGTKVYLNRNPIQFQFIDVGPTIEEVDLLDLTKKVIFRKRTGDPRLVLQHKMQINFAKDDKNLFDLLNGYTMFWGRTAKLKLWQFDAHYDSGKADSTGAIRCMPKTSSDHKVFFCPFRHISDESSDVSLTKVWVNGALQNSGYAIDYTEGKVTFASDQNPSAIIKMHFVWRPQIVFLKMDVNPLPGYRQYDQKYETTITVQEL